MSASHAANGRPGERQSNSILILAWMGIVDRMRDEGATFPFLDAHGTHHLRSIGRPQTTSMSNRPRGRETMMPMIRRGGFSRRPQYNRTEGRDDEREEEYDRIIWRPRHVNY